MIYSRNNIVTLSFLVILFLSTTILSAGPWPGVLPGTEIGSGLPAGYEPSGAVWHTRLHKLLTVWDNGMVSMMNYDGSDITNWSVSGDLEGICIADPNTDFIYVGVERPDDGIKEFNIVTAQVTRFFDLTPWMQSVDPNLGLEAVTFVPDTGHPEGGYFYTGMQEDGMIYIFELPIKSTSTDSTVTFIDTVYSGWLGISGLHYETENEVLYAIWRSVNKIRAMAIDGTDMVEWDLVGDSQEGVALWEGESLGQGQIFVAEDNGEVWRYEFNSILNMTIEGNGLVNIQPAPPSYYGTSDTLTAIPDPGYHFVEWSGDLTGSENPAVLLMDYDKDVTALFEPLGIEERKSMADVVAELHVSPNPFRDRVDIRFILEHGLMSPELKIYDVTGRLVKYFFVPTVYTLPSMVVSWNGRTNQGQKACSGIYFCELKAGDLKVIKKIIFLK